MANDGVFPISASALYLFGVFLAALLTFDVVFVRIWKLGKIGWKRVDYVWLGVAAIGLFGAAAEVRRMVSANVVEVRKARQIAAYSALRNHVRFMTGIVVCGTFVRSEDSPTNLNELQREHDEICRFASRLYKALPPEPPDTLKQEQFRNRPGANSRILLEILSELDESLATYIATERVVAETVAARERTVGEVTFVVAWPLLLAVALALRITKVTGEIRLEA